MGRRISEGRSVKVTVPQNTVINQGDFVLLDGFLGLAVQAVTTGVGETKPLALNIEPGEFETSQINAADAFAAAAKAYWDAANKRFTTTAAGNNFAGIVTQAKDASNVIWLWFAPQQPALNQAAAVAALVDNSTGVADGTVVDVGAAFNQATLNGNFAEAAQKINAVITALKNAGLMA